MSEAEPQSPCISICVLDDDDVCQGCFRTAAEITDWFMLSADEKRSIIARSIERRDADSSFKLL
ncbi:MAG: DUF1289 domain-containing protein [Pseudomonadales bacterium]